MHYGIPGMKWGKRKQSYNSTGNNRVKNAAAGAYLRSKGLPSDKTESIRNVGMNPAKRIATAAAGAHLRSKGLSTKSLAQNKSRANDRKIKREQKQIKKESIKRGKEISKRILNGEILTSGSGTKRKFYDSVSKKPLGRVQIKDLERYEKDSDVKTTAAWIASMAGTTIAVAGVTALIPD